MGEAQTFTAGTLRASHLYLESTFAKRGATNETKGRSGWPLYPSLTILLPADQALLV